MGGTCGRHGGEKKYTQGFGGGNLKLKRPLGRFTGRGDNNFTIVVKID